MPHVRLSVADRHTQQTALDRVRDLSCAGLDVAGFLEQIDPIVGQVVPNGTDEIGAPFWYTVDPQSHLITSIYGQGCDVDPAQYMEWELLATDFMKTADVLQRASGVQTLHEVTNGKPERSRIYVEVMEPHGMAQELLVALRSSSGENWGTTRLNRRPGEAMFSGAEIDFMASASGLIAQGVQRGLLVGEAMEPEYPDAPGLIVMTASGEVEHISSGSQSWFERLPDDDGCHGGVPISVRAAGVAAISNVDRRGSSGTSTAHVALRDGGWATVHGAVMGKPPNATVSVIIQPARPDRIAPLLMSIYGLTSREQEVAQAVLRGGSTTDLARQLAISPLTVQQHLKHIFEKLEVGSRGELVAKVYFDCYDRRTRDNRGRIADTRPIRGGPKASGS